MISIFYPYNRSLLSVLMTSWFHTKSEAKYQAHMRLVLEVLKREKFYVCKAKSNFAQKEIRYLGHILDKQSIRTNP
jgi:hypothetical protein